LASLARGLKVLQTVVQEIFWEYPGDLSYYDLPRQLRVQRVVDHWPQIAWMFPHFCLPQAGSAAKELSGAVLAQGKVAL
jgi:hypothetical protein